jgi:hypothetical protein
MINRPNQTAPVHALIALWFQIGLHGNQEYCPVWMTPNPSRCTEPRESVAVPNREPLVRGQ